MRWTGQFLAVSLICAVFSPLSRASMAPQNRPKIGAEGLPGIAAEAPGLNGPAPAAPNSISLTLPIPTLSDASNTAPDTLKLAPLPADPSALAAPDSRSASASEAPHAPHQAPSGDATQPSAHSPQDSASLLRGMGEEIRQASPGEENAPLAEAMDGAKKSNAESQGLGPSLQDTRVWDYSFMASSLHFGGIYTFSPDGSILATRGKMNFDPEEPEVHEDSRVSNREEIRVFSSPAVRVSIGPRSEEEKRGRDTVFLWDVHAGQIINGLGYTGRMVQNIAISPDNSKVAVAYGNGAAGQPREPELRVWDSATGRLLRRYSGHRGYINTLNFSPDGQSLLSGSSDGELHIMDLNRNDGEDSPPPSQDLIQNLGLLASPRTALPALSRQENMRAVVALARRLLAPTASDPWETVDSEFQWKYGTARAAQFSRNGLIAVGFSKGAVLIFSSDQPGRYREMGRTYGDIRSLEFSQDDSRLLAVSNDDKGDFFGPGEGTVMVWDLVTGRTLDWFVDKRKKIKGASFSPDGKRVITYISSIKTDSDPVRLAAEEGPPVRIWDIASKQHWRALPTQPQKGMSMGWLDDRYQYPYINYARFSPDGRHIVLMEYDESLSVWDAASLEMLFKIRHGKVISGEVRTAPLQAAPRMISAGEKPSLPGEIVSSAHDEILPEPSLSQIRSRTSSNLMKMGSVAAVLSSFLTAATWGMLKFCGADWLAIAGLIDFSISGVAGFCVIYSLLFIWRHGGRFTLSGLLKFILLLAVLGSSLTSSIYYVKESRSKIYRRRIISNLGSLHEDVSRPNNPNHFIAFLSDLQRLHMQIQGRGEGELLAVPSAESLRFGTAPHAALEYYYPATDLIRTRLETQEGPYSEQEIRTLYKEYSRSYGGNYLGQYVTDYREFKNLVDMYQFYRRLSRRPGFEEENPTKLYLDYLDYRMDKRPNAKGIDPMIWKEKASADFAGLSSTPKARLTPSEVTRLWINMTMFFYAALLLGESWARADAPLTPKPEDPS